MKKFLFALFLFSTIFTKADAIEIVVTYPPGGVNDITGRAVAEYLRSRSTLSPVVLNKPGGDGVIGIMYSINTKTDNLVIANTGPFLFNLIIKNKIPYNVETDFTLFGPISTVPSSIIVSKKSNIKTMEEFVAAVKTRRLNCGVNNQGTAMGLKTFLTGLQFNSNVEIIHYRGTSQLVPDLLSGQLDCVMDPVSSYVNLHESGKVTIIGVAGDRAYNPIKNVPLMSLYVPGFRYLSWYAVAIPNHMSKEKQLYYINLLNGIYTDENFVRTIVNSGMLVSQPNTNTHQWYKDEYIKWDTIRKNLKIEKID